MTHKACPDHFSFQIYKSIFPYAILYLYKASEYALLLFYGIGALSIFARHSRLIIIRHHDASIMLLKAALHDEETLRITRGPWYHFEILNELARMSESNKGNRLVACIILARFT